jgi:hypothetical protein
MPYCKAGSLDGRGLPLRVLRQPKIPESRSQHGESSSVSANSFGPYRVRPAYNYGDSHSEMNIRVRSISVTDIPINHRNSTPNDLTLPNNTSITPQHTQYDPSHVAGPNGFGNTSQSYQPSPSPPEGPSSQNTPSSYPAGDQVPAGTIYPAVYTPPNTQLSSHPSTQQLPKEYFNKPLVRRAVTWGVRCTPAAKRLNA